MELYLFITLFCVTLPLFRVARKQLLNLKLLQTSRKKVRSETGTYDRGVNENAKGRRRVKYDRGGGGGGDGVKG